MYDEPGWSDIISERGSILGGAAKSLYATDGFHDRIGM
jgi:hypothetical protein